MSHQRVKARAMASKHGMDGGVPPMPPMPPGMGAMNAQPPLPQGMADPGAVMQAPPDGGAPSPGFKRGGRVGC